MMIRSILFVTIAALCVSSTFASDPCHGDDFGKPGDFDLYVFSQTWMGEFCHGHNYPGCNPPTDWMRANTTIHGLWPQYNSSRSGHYWPQCCDSPYGEHVNSSIIYANQAEFDKYWPNVKGKDTDVSFWDHEWGKHGTCSGLTQLQYFNSGFAAELAVPTPAILGQNAGGSLSRSTIEAAYNNGTPCQQGADSCMVSLQCSGSYLMSVVTCFDLDLNRTACPTESTRPDCPNTVKISSFDNSFFGIRF